MSPVTLPPGPRLPKSVQSVAFWTRPLAFLEQCRSRYGSRFTLRLLTAPPFVILSDPEEIKQVFTAPAPKSDAPPGRPVIDAQTRLAEKATKFRAFSSNLRFVPDLTFR